MGTTLTTTGTTSLARQRQELEQKLLTLVHAQSVAYEELKKRDHPATDWTITTSDGASSDGWTGNSLVNAYKAHIVAEEKRREEKAALELFLALVPRQIIALADGAPQVAIDAIAAQASQLEQLADQSRQRARDVQRRLEQNEELREMLRDERALPPIPVKVDATTRLAEAMDRVHEQLVSFRYRRPEPSPEVLELIDEMRAERRRFYDYLDSVNTRLEELRATADAAATNSPTSGAASGASASVDPGDAFVVFAVPVDAGTADPMGASATTPTPAVDPDATAPGSPPAANTPQQEPISRDDIGTVSRKKKS